MVGEEEGFKVGAAVGDLFGLDVGVTVGGARQRFAFAWNNFPSGHVHEGFSLASTESSNVFSQIQVGFVESVSERAHFPALLHDTPSHGLLSGEGSGAEIEKLTVLLPAKDATPLSCATTAPFTVMEYEAPVPHPPASLS